MSLERADGFYRKIRELQKEIIEIYKMPAEELKKSILEELQEEKDLFRGMYDSEIDIYRGKSTRPSRKFLLNDDGFTLGLNPDWVPDKEDN